MFPVCYHMHVRFFLHMVIDMQRHLVKADLCRPCCSRPCDCTIVLWNRLECIHGKQTPFLKLILIVHIHDPSPTPPLPSPRHTHTHTHTHTRARAHAHTFTRCLCLPIIIYIWVIKLWYKINTVRVTREINLKLLIFTKLKPITPLHFNLFRRKYKVQTLTWSIIH